MQSCDEDQFQSDWKKSLQTKLTNKTLIMKSNSIIDQYSASGDDELNDETIDAEDSEDDAKLPLITVSHSKLQNQCSRVLDYKPSRPHARDVMNFVTSHNRITITVSVLLQSPARVTRTPRRSS